MSDVLYYAVLTSSLSFLFDSYYLPIVFSHYIQHISSKILRVMCFLCFFLLCFPNQTWKKMCINFGSNLPLPSGSHTFQKQQKLSKCREKFIIPFDEKQGKSAQRLFTPFQFILPSLPSFWKVRIMGLYSVQTVHSLPKCTPISYLLHNTFCGTLAVDCLLSLQVGCRG